MAVISARSFHSAQPFSLPATARDSVHGTGRHGSDSIYSTTGQETNSRPVIPPTAPTPPSERHFNAGDLYGASGKPSAADIRQDDIGDCFFIATAGAVANQSPERIKQSISYNSDTGNFTVELYDGKEWASIEVNQSEIKNNIFRNGGSWLDNGKSDAPIWPAVMETAYAKMRGGTLDAGYNILNKGGKARDAMQTITGTRGRDISRLNANLIGDRNIEAQIGQALKEGRPVTLSTDPEYESNWFTRLFGDKDAPQDGLADNHVYVVEEIRLNSNGEAVVRLRNPWQRNESELVNEYTAANNESPFIEVKMKDVIKGRGFEYFNIGPK